MISKHFLTWSGYPISLWQFVTYGHQDIECAFSSFAIPWIAACQASLCITNSWSLLKLMSIESVMPSSHLILCRPLILLPPIPPSIRVFSNASTLHMRWPKYWSFSFSISPSNEHPELISFRKNWISLHLRGYLMVLPGGSDSKKSGCNVGDPGLIPGSGRCSGGWLPTPVFLPGEFHVQRSLAGYSPWGHKELDTT